jgi:hypothetical protein
MDRKAGDLSNIGLRFKSTRPRLNSDAQYAHIPRTWKPEIPGELPPEQGVFSSRIAKFQTCVWAETVSLFERENGPITRPE